MTDQEMLEKWHWYAMCSSSYRPDSKFFKYRKTRIVFLSSLSKKWKRVLFIHELFHVLCRAFLGFLDHKKMDIIEGWFDALWYDKITVRMENPYRT